MSRNNAFFRREEQIAGMKAQTIGVEVEMNSITRRKAAKVAAGLFGTDRVQDTAYRNGYYCWSAWDADGREWKFQRDSSICGPDSEMCEMVTPILHYEDIGLLQSLIRALRKAGAKSDATRGCGVHIHIGADGHTPESLRTLANIMASHEQMLIAALGISEERLDNYCRPVDPEFLEQVNKVKPKTMSALADVWYESQGCEYGRDQHYNISRYHMLNLHATFTKGTVEFRLFEFESPKDGKQNGLHAGQLKAFIQLCLAMSEMAKITQKAARAARSAERECSQRRMRAWMYNMNMVGEEFETARELFSGRLQKFEVCHRESQMNEEVSA